MHTLETAILLLVLVTVSNVISQLSKRVSLPMVQIGLGAGFGFAAFLGVGAQYFQAELDPELFFVLFIAPLLFIDAKRARKRELLKYRRPILLLAVPLVILTVAGLGGAISLLEPAIPLAVCCALAAALAPTDAVAIHFVRDKARIPGRIMSILEGEALINDASGLATFAFAVTVSTWQTYDIQATASGFGLKLLSVVGFGVAFGIGLTYLKLLGQKLMRHKGIENATLYVLMELVTPFIIYIAAEAPGGSGVLAVVVSGVMHSFTRQQVRSEYAHYKMISKSVWDTVIFALNGMVFILLGLQLPGIVTELAQDGGLRQIGICLLAAGGIALVLYFLRFVWALVTIRNREDITGKARLKESLIIALSGVKGMVTLATAMSLARADFIFISAAVILYTMVVADKILPLISPRAKTEDQEAIAAKSLELEVANRVLRRLGEEADRLRGMEKSAVRLQMLQIVMRDYQMRVQKLTSVIKGNRFSESSLQAKVIAWREEKRKEIEKSGRLIKKKRLLAGREALLRETQEARAEIDAFVLTNLKRLAQTCEIPADAPKTHRSQGSVPEMLDTEELQLLIDEYELRCESEMTSRGIAMRELELYQEVVNEALQYEREILHAEADSDRISSAQLRAALSELDLMEMAMNTL